MTTNHLKQINNLMLKAYLEKTGWILNQKYPNQRVFLFIKYLDDEEFSLTIPRSEEAKDYSVRLQDMLCALSKIEGISKEQILYDIVNPNFPLKILSSNPMHGVSSSHNKVVNIQEILPGEKLFNKDRMSFRIISKSTEDGTLPLDYAANAVEGLKKLVVSAIYTEKFPRKHFIKAGGKVDLSRYRLGQSKVGSYIFNIDIDITELEQIGFNDKLQLDNLQMSRKVIKRIQNGIYNIVRASEKDEIQELIQEGYKYGLNANMCEAILSLNTDEPLELETNVEWAENIEPPTNIQNKVSIKTKDFYLIEKLVTAYKENTCQITTIEGYIYRLNNDNKEVDENFERYILINSIIDEKNRKIKVYVSSIDYKNAYFAHGNNNKVRVIGELDKSGKMFTLYEYDKFEVLEQ